MKRIALLLILCSTFVYAEETSAPNIESAQSAQEAKAQCKEKAGTDKQALRECLQNWQKNKKLLLPKNIQK